GDGSRPASPSGAALTRPEVPAAPAEVRDLSTEHFQVTITSDGAAIADWVLPGYKDEVRNRPVDLVPQGTRAYGVIVEAGGRALDSSQSAFASVGDPVAHGALSFEARDASVISHL